MKTLIKLSLVIFSIFSMAGCQKTELNPTSSTTEFNENFRIHQGSSGTIDGESFTDKDKCKKCHPSTKTMGIDWEAPYMSDNRYNSIEDLINDFDFTNNVHGVFNKKNTNGISNEQKQELINYLYGIAIKTEK